MPTHIRTYQNKSARSAVAFNSENVGNSFWIPEHDTIQTGDQWISWHKDRPLLLFTKKGVCHIWDKDWKIHGEWEGSTNEVIFLDGGDEGVGGNIGVTIADDGNITMKKAG